MIAYIIVIVLLIYSSFYFIFTDEITIYQSDIEHFDLNMLYNKQPIVISNIAEDLFKIIKEWFNVNIIDRNLTNDMLWARNKYKYLLINADDAEITLCNPKHNIINGIPDNSLQLTTIKIRGKKMLIVPFKWYYNINGNIEMIGIHDYITKVFEYII